MFWVFPPKCRCWKSMTCWCKTTRRYLCKRVLPKCIEFILNLVKWLIWQPWRNAEARSHVLVQWITFQVCWNMSFPARPGKISISIEMMWLSAEMYCVWGGCNTRDAKNIWSNSICCIPQWPYLLDSFEWAVYGGLAQHFTPQSTVPMQWTALLIWCCVLCGSAEMAPPNAKIPSAIMTMQGSNDHPMKLLHRFPGSPASRLVDNQSWNKKCAGLEYQSDFVETREIYNYIYIANIWIYTFCILNEWI